MISLNLFLSMNMVCQLAFIKSMLDKIFPCFICCFHSSHPWTCSRTSHISFCERVQSRDWARVVVWPVLYNLRQRRINRGPPGKPLSSRSAKRLQCQQISGTQLVPNRAGWHTHKHTQTLTHTHSNTNNTVIQHRPCPGCPVKGAGRWKCSAC